MTESEYWQEIVEEERTIQIIEIGIAKGILNYVEGHALWGQLFKRNNDEDNLLKIVLNWSLWDDMDASNWLHDVGKEQGLWMAGVSRAWAWIHLGRGLEVDLSNWSE